MDEFASYRIIGVTPEHVLFRGKPFHQKKGKASYNFSKVQKIHIFPTRPENNAEKWVFIGVWVKKACFGGFLQGFWRKKRPCKISFARSILLFSLPFVL